MDQEHSLKIPKERIAVLIGKDGSGKKQLEKATGTRISIDSDEGDITIAGDDALQVYLAREIIRAIGRGFNPEIAFMLQKQDYGLEVISISPKTKNDALRLRGRLIGEEGKSRQRIEELTGAYISVYGKTVSIIGEFIALRDARKAIEMLLSGSTHASVYRVLEKKKRMKKFE